MLNISRRKSSKTPVEIPILHVIFIILYRLYGVFFSIFFYHLYIKFFRCRDQLKIINSIYGIGRSIVTGNDWFLLYSFSCVGLRSKLTETDGITDADDECDCARGEFWVYLPTDTPVSKFAHQLYSRCSVRPTSRAPFKCVFANTLLFTSTKPRD